MNNNPKKISPDLLTTSIEVMAEGVPTHKPSLKKIAETLKEKDIPLNINAVKVLLEEMKEPFISIEG